MEMNFKELFVLLIAGSLFVFPMSCAAPEPSEPAGEPDSAPDRADEPEAVSPAESAPADEPTPTPPTESALLSPSLAAQTAPARFKVRFETTEGPFVVEVIREWAPRGADRFYNLVKIGYFEDIAFFRVLDGFVAQFGIHGDPTVSAKWQSASIQDDPVNQANARGTLVFATAGPNTRTTQLFINLVDNSRGLDSRGFAPFGRIIEGMDVVDSLYSGYGEGAPRGRGPSQEQIRRVGNDYLKQEFPELDYIRKAALIK